MLTILNFALWGLLTPMESGAGGAGAGPAPSATPASATSSSVPAASTPAQGSQTPPSPSGTPSDQSTPPGLQQPQADDLQDGNWRELRQRYEQQKAQIAQLTSQSTAVAQVASHAQGLAKQLGYTDQDFAEAFSSNPIRTLEILQQEAADQQQSQPQSPQTPDLAQQLEAMVKAKLDPIADFQNRQATEVAMGKYESTLDSTIKADPILSQAPDEIVSIVKDYLGEYFSTQPEILLAMKQKGDFSMVSDSVKFVAGRLHAGFKAWLAKSNGGGPSLGQQSPASGKPNGRPTLDQIIADPGILGSQYKE
jgi:hypothetical protein